MKIPLKMGTKEKKYGVFINNALLKLKDTREKTQSQRTAMLGQVVIIDERFEGNVIVRFLKEGGDYWESTQFLCPEDHIVHISEKLWPFIASIVSPQERLKLAKNKNLCDKLKTICKDVVVGFLDTKEVHLGKVKYIGAVKGMGHCYGIELHEKKKDNKCNGSCAGIQYFMCLPGYGVFTTIEKIIPSYNNFNDTEILPPPKIVSNLELSLENNMLSLMNSTDGKPKNEEIITKYGEYPKKLTTPSKPQSCIRTSLSLQNMLDVENMSVNTNNDFDQNTVIQPDKAYLMNDQKKIRTKSEIDWKMKNKSEVDLVDIIGGSWSGATDPKELEKFGSLKKNLDKNDNIKEKISYMENGNTNTLTKRNRSMNPLLHFLDSSNSVKRNTSKFYTDCVENDKDDVIMPNRKQDNVKKINEKSEQLARTSTFYLPKYHDPQPGTTNDLVLGSLVEVMNDISDNPLYGVVRWMGVNNETNFILVGIELEEEHSHLPLTLTDGVHNGERFFKCADKRGLFVPIEQCHKDSRFQDVTPTPVHEASVSKQIVDCPVIPGAVAPLCIPTEEEVGVVCGKLRGIQGHHNSCYLDVTLFAMFTYTSVFDSLLFRPKDQYDIEDYEEVQRVLREEIVNPLRKNLFVSADHVMKLRQLLDKWSSVSGLMSEEKDPEEFLNSLLAEILKAEPFLKLNSGQEAFHYQLFVEKDAHLTLPTVQQLFEQSFLTSNIKLKEVPSCLIIQMPRFGKNYKMYNRILPSQLLDVTDVIEDSPRQCIVCGHLAKYECRECFDDCSNSGLESTAFCLECLKTVHRHEKRKHHRAINLEVSPDFSILQDACKPPRLFMELFAVICIETSHYVTFVKCGVGHEAPWCFFDSMADRQGERNGYNIPEMVACPDVSRWLSDETICKQLHEDFPLDRHLPEQARRLLCDAYICMYQSSDVMMYR